MHREDRHKGSFCLWWCCRMIEWSHRTDPRHWGCPTDRWLQPSSVSSRNPWRSAKAHRLSCCLHSRRQPFRQPCWCGPRLHQRSSDKSLCYRLAHLLNGYWSSRRFHSHRLILRLRRRNRNPCPSDRCSSVPHQEDPHNGTSCPSCHYPDLRWSCSFDLHHCNYLQPRSPSPCAPHSSLMR